MSNQYFSVNLPTEIEDYANIIFGALVKPKRGQILNSVILKKCQARIYLRKLRLICLAVEWTKYSYKDNMQFTHQGKVCMSQVVYQARAYPGFQGMKP